MKVFVPVVNVGDDHGPGGDGNSLVGVAVDDVDVLVALGRQDHGELPAVGGKDLYPTPKNLYLSGRVCFLQAFSKVQYSLLKIKVWLAVIKSEKSSTALNHCCVFK